jgi:50S ribosomal protein L16 3-hydroxylase
MSKRHLVTLLMPPRGAAAAALCRRLGVVMSKRHLVTLLMPPRGAAAAALCRCLGVLMSKRHLVTLLMPPRGAAAAALCRCLGVVTGQNAGMPLNQPWPLLGGLTPEQFMRRHWQKRPLLVRQAWPNVQPPATRQQLFALAARDDVESRLISQQPGDPGSWRLRRGPMPRRGLPPLKHPGWTLLVQGLDLHLRAAHEMLSRFRFVPDARLDDLMMSWASDGGGVGPHLDSYDVFLLQVQGRRRWRIGRVPDDRIVPGLPVRILEHFEPEQDWVLEPGDMLYLPPRWGHDGIAEGECMTCSIGFRVPGSQSLASELLSRLADDTGLRERLYRDPAQPATAHPGRVPEALQAFAHEALRARLAKPRLLEQHLGELLTEPKPQVWFDAAAAAPPGAAVVLDRRSRMMYDERQVFINGESFRAGGRDARLMARLADSRRLAAKQVERLSPAARELLDEWLRQGWLRVEEEGDG